MQDEDMISPEHQKAITALARCVHLQRSFCYTLILTPLSDVKIIEEDLGDILQERKNRLKRFLRSVTMLFKSWFRAAMSLQMVS